jgi:hypothetical protein
VELGAGEGSVGRREDLGFPFDGYCNLRRM